MRLFGLNKYDRCNNIKELRTRAGMSREDLADAAGVNERTIQRWENGEVDPVKMSIETALKLADVLGVSPYDVFDCFIVPHDYGDLAA